MHRIAVVLVALACVLGLAACDRAAELAGDARSVVEEARTQVDDLVSTAERVGDRFTWCGAAVRLGTAVVQRDPEAARTAADDLRSNAPRELEDELRTVVEAAARSQAGDTGALLDQDVQRAGRTLLETAVRDCGLGEQ